MLGKASAKFCACQLDVLFKSSLSIPHFLKQFAVGEGLLKIEKFKALLDEMRLVL